ncbi:MAG: TonB-dependent receptor, partial [Draconibacterium sp.]
MKIILFLILLIPFSLAGQDYSISGYIVDKQSGERLTGATIYEINSRQGTTTNNFGFFSFTPKNKTVDLQFRFIGFQSENIHLELSKDTLLNVELTKGIDIEEVKVTASKRGKNNPELSALNQARISMDMIEAAPVILGETDVLKTLQYLPGIKQGAENTAGFNVRGGSSDQNLILLDGVPVYNANHLLGFFSVFNSDALKNVDLIKGGIPARYGGRLSSVLNVTMKEGNMKRSSGIFSISPVAGRFTFETPIKKDTSSFIISFRRTLFDIPMLAIEKLMGENGNFGYYFYDLNAKTNWIFNSKSRLYLSIYAGKDKQYSNTKEGDSRSKYNYEWGNITTVLRWNKIFSPKIFSNSLVYYSRYHHIELGKTKSNNANVLFKTSSELQDFSFQT